MSESTYQAKVIKHLEKNGWFVLKLIRTNKSGICDILALKEREVPYFIEVKGVRTPISELQKYMIRLLKKLGFKAVVAREGVDKLDDLC